jgi:hypothetical protein
MKFIGQTSQEERAKLWSEFDHVLAWQYAKKAERWPSTFRQSDLTKRIAVLRERYEEVKANYPGGRFWAETLLPQGGLGAMTEQVGLRWYLCHLSARRGAAPAVSVEQGPPGYLAWWVPYLVDCGWMLQAPRSISCCGASRGRLPSGSPFTGRRTGSLRRAMGNANGGPIHEDSRRSRAAGIAVAGDAGRAEQK